jgi:hypothetical protein
MLKATGRTAISLDKPMASGAATGEVIDAGAVASAQVQETDEALRGERLAAKIEGTAPQAQKGPQEAAGDVAPEKEAPATAKEADVPKDLRATAGIDTSTEDSELEDIAPNEVPEMSDAALTEVIGQLAARGIGPSSLTADDKRDLLDIYNNAPGNDKSRRRQYKAATVLRLLRIAAGDEKALEKKTTKASAPTKESVDTKPEPDGTQYRTEDAVSDARSSVDAALKKDRELSYVADNGEAFSSGRVLKYAIEVLEGSDADATSRADIENELAEIISGRNFPQSHKDAASKLLDAFSSTATNAEPDGTQYRTEDGQTRKPRTVLSLLEDELYAPKPSEPEQVDWAVLEHSGGQWAVHHPLNGREVFRGPSETSANKWVSDNPLPAKERFLDPEEGETFDKNAKGVAVVVGTKEYIRGGTLTGRFKKFAGEWLAEFRPLDGSRSEYLFARDLTIESTFPMDGTKFRSETDTTERELTPEEKKTVRNEVERMLGYKVSVAFVDRITTAQNREALGSFKDDLIKIAKKQGNHKDTAMHEAVHAAEKIFLSDEEMALLRKIQPDDEKRAEGIIDYINTGKYKGPVAAKRWIQRIVDAIKRLFGGETVRGRGEQIRTLEDLYSSILGGEMGERAPRDSKTSESKYLMAEIGRAHV